ncbi:allophanate hydrolase [Teredinibacter haidensis]|uniref:allophanate hydrolase n=1 Tax=Teredinibacter haidensis TaxID=2731755 RepID=UPI000948FD65|nr:allophanate hydrolase [Teredinibacter haidensis]
MLSLKKIDLTISGLLNHYRAGDFKPEQLLQALRKAADDETDNPIWIHRLSNAELQPYIDRLNQYTAHELPLYGIPFAVKDNIDLAQVPTTAACPDFSYTPSESATVVARLIEAGAIPVGKTNMDQFATGLVGVRSPKPWGPCKNAFDPTIISGGSSSGSAIALAKGFVSFSLGTDTAGSGRVPASLNNLVGLKPSRGLISTHGVVPACRSLDCVSIFSLNGDDANTVFDAAVSFDSNDPFSRENIYSNGSRYYQKTEAKRKLGIPSTKSLEFFGNVEGQQLFHEFIAKQLPDTIELVDIDITPFLQAAKLLYGGPWVAERYIATHELFHRKPDALLPVIQTIIGEGQKPTASDAFQASYELQKFRQQALVELQKVDAIITPTNPNYFPIEAVENDPIALNSQLGFYTNFMNLLDCAAIAIPTGFYQNGVGFGVTLFHQAFTDKVLLSMAASLQNHLKLPLGAFSGEFRDQGNSQKQTPYRAIDIVVCGAHMEGLALNWQLTERGAQLKERTKTSANYRFYALSGGPPIRPALVRDSRSNACIDVEIWRIPASELGSFIAEIPSPLGIGKVEMEDGRWLSGFICDDWGLSGAEEITQHSAWRAYLLNGTPNK